MKKLFLLVFICFVFYSFNCYAYPNSYRKNIVDSIITDDGRILIGIKVPGKPPEVYRAPIAEPTRTTVILSQVPAFDWSFGCSATSAAMIAGHYDNMGYPTMYSGPTNGSLMPMDNSSWPDWIDSYGATRHQCPLSATHNGLDGRTTDGHVDDYWIGYGATGPDPWVGGTEHTHGECTGDYMKTNQWIDPPNSINTDGGTTFWYWSNGAPMTESDILTNGLDDRDGAYGFNLFCESRGYTVNDLYSQYIVEEGLTYGFSYNDFKAEIDAGRPVLIHVTDHTMVGYGYNDSSNLIYIHDTWDYDDHTMTWAGSYWSGSSWLQHYAVSVLELAPSTINVWTGNSSNYWGTSANWSLGHIPTATEDVEIPNVNMPCIVDFSDKTCNNLTIYPGATVKIYDQILTVNNDLTVQGTIEMTQADAYLNVYHDIVWESGSSLDVLNSSTYIQVWGDWNFESGANVNPTQGFVDFEGTASTYIRCYDDNCSFYNIRFYRTVGLSGFSTEDLVINGLTYINSAGAFNNYSDDDIWMRGYLNYYGTFDLTGTGSSTVYFDGVSQGIHKYSTNDGVFNNVTFSSSTGTTITGGGLTAEGNIVINQGFFDPGTDPIYVGGNWTNSVGSAGFVEGTGRVIFNGGNYHQYCSNETFNELEVNKASGGAFRMNGTNVVCAAYDWTAGAVDVLSGSFTANDLLDNAVQGGFYLNSGGTIDLTNSGTGTYVDLKGDIHIYGGTMTVSGSISEWPYQEDALIEMSGGVLDLTTCGIYISSSYILTTDITGGTIRTAYGFTGNRTDFNPTGGTIELYDSTDASLSMGAGSNFYNVIINKSSTDNGIDKMIKSPKSERVIVDRDGSVIELTRSYTVNASSELDINGDLLIDNGTFNLNGFTVDVADDVLNYGELTVDGTLEIGDDFYLYSGSTVDLSGTIQLGTYAGRHGSATHSSGSTFNQTGGDYYVESIHLYNGSQFNGTSGTTHIYVDGHVINNNIEIDDPDSYFYRFYVDTGANAALSGCLYDLDVTHTTNLYGLLDVNSYTMNTIYSNVYDGGDLIIDSGGTVNVTGNGPYFFSGGSLTMISDSELNSEQNIRFYIGSIENVSGGEIYIAEDFTDYDEIFSPTGGSVTFDGSSASSISGPTAFYNLNIDKTGATVTANAPFSMYDLVINSGVLDPGVNAIEIGGNWTNNVGTAGFTEGTGTVTFNGSNEADITTNETFYNLALDKTNPQFYALEIMDGVTINVTNDLNITDATVEMNNGSTLNIANDLNIALNAGLNAFGEPGLNIYVGGDWTNNNTIYDSWKGFYPGTSTVTFNGSAEQIMDTDCANENFYDLIVDKSADDFRAADNIHVLGDLTISNGIWDDYVGGLNHFMYGDVFVASTANWYGSGSTVTFKGTSDQTFEFLGSSYLTNIVVDKTATREKTSTIPGGEEAPIKIVDDQTRSQTVILNSNLLTQSNGTMLIEEGTLNLNGHSAGNYGDIIINDGGTILVDSDAVLKVGDYGDLIVNSGGILQVEGSAGHEAKVTRFSIYDYYDFNVESGGTISADYAIFERMSANGINVKNGAIIDATHPFDNCTFRNGIAGGTLLTIDNNQTQTIDNVTFPTNTWSGTYNVSKTLNQGNLTFTNAIGDFAGPDYEYDTYNRIEWDGYGPDLEITNVVWTDTNPYVCDMINVEITIYNNGNVDIPYGVAFFVDLYYNLVSPPVPSQYGEQYEWIGDGIPAGDFVIVDFDVVCDVAETWSSYVQVDTDQTIIELDEGNNVWGPDAITWNGLPVIDDLTIQYNSGTNEIELNWTYPITVDQYIIYRSTDPYDFAGADVFTSSTESYSETVTGTKYFYHVTAERTCTPSENGYKEKAERLRKR